MVRPRILQIAGALLFVLASGGPRPATAPQLLDEKYPEKRICLRERARVLRRCDEAERHPT